MIDEPPYFYIENGVQEECHQDSYQICAKLKRSKTMSTDSITSMP